MLICGPLHAAALIGLVAGAQLGFGAWSLIMLGGFAGLGLPPVSATMRAEFGRRLPSSARTAAYSFVYLVQEVAILTGPLLVSVLVEMGSPSLALVVAASVSGGGAIAFAALSEAKGQWSDAPTEAPLIRSMAIASLLGITFLLGCTLGGLQVATAALALMRGDPALAGVLIAALSVGGILGALLYGGHHWRTDPATRLLGLLCLVGVALTPLATVPPLPIIGVLLALVGVALNPALTTMSLLVDRHSLARSAEAFGWLSTAVGAGTATGSAVAGALTQRYGSSPAILFAAAAAYSAVLVALIARRRLRPRQEAACE